MKKILIICVSLCFLVASGITQPSSTQWYLEDPVASGYNSIGVDALHEYLGDTRPSQEVIVAILDSGVDIGHADLEENIWVNADEIPGNDIDDDGNGYVDDVHGWNFLGNADGKNIVNETLEVTRLYAHYKEYFKGKDLTKLSKKDEEKYKEFLEYERVVQNRRNSAKAVVKEVEESIEFIDIVLDTFDAYYPDQKLNESFLENFEPGEHELLKIVADIFKNAREYGLELTNTSDLRKEIETSYEEVIQEKKNDLDYRYNPDFKSREIVGDNYADQKECCYGNNDVRGGFAFHGTHVSGIVGAAWDDEGTRGVAKHVTIMPIRTVPNGDEHDKDVANAIRYAVDNGAHVINMSFGKGQSWNKGVVDAAVKYARKHDVLLVHGAGNDGANNDEVSNYPNAVFDKTCIFGRKYADNWIEVGALNFQQGAHAIAPFSNYGQKMVDIFAPGMYIYSTAPENQYQYAQGTSMASPVVAGIAAVIRAYFPELKANEVKEILMQSVTPFEGELIRPGDNEKVKGSELSASGGMVNAYQAFKLAEQKVGSIKKDGQKDRA